MKSKNISMFALYTALAFIFSYIESLLPLPFPVPGMKLGLANIIIVVVLYKNGFPQAIAISIIRTMLTALTFGNLFMLLFSLVGTTLSLLGMSLIKRFTKCSIISVSALGGVLHNIGQILVAILVLRSTTILSYLPILYFTGLVSGVLMGILSYECIRRLPTHVLNSMN